jgi:hypothetical protein
MGHVKSPAARIWGRDVREPLETVNLDWRDDLKDLEEIGMIKQTVYSPGKLEDRGRRRWQGLDF